MLIGVEGVPHILTSSSHFYQAKIPVIHYNQSLAYQFFFPTWPFTSTYKHVIISPLDWKKITLLQFLFANADPLSYSLLFWFVFYTKIGVTILTQKYSAEILPLASQPIKNTSLSSYKVYEHYVTSLTSPVTVHLVPSPLTLTPFVVFWTCHTFFHNSLFVCC